MKRSQPEPSTSAPPKKQATTRMLESVNIGPVSTEDEMNIKVLVFQNKKLAERLEVMKLDEERLRERLDEVKKQRASEFEILSLINRHWTQLDEDISVMCQSYESGTAEEFGDQNDTALSYLEHLAQLEQEQMKEEVAKRAANSKQCVKTLLSFMEKAGCFPPRVLVSSQTSPPGETPSSTGETTKDEAMETDEMKEADAEQVPVVKESDDGTSRTEPVVEKKQEETTKKEELEVPTKQPEIEQLKSDNMRLRELMTALQLKQQTTSLEFSEIRDKYALTNREISELNTQIQDSEYDLQKANHRVENLVKRLNELEEMRKKIREGEMPAKEEIKDEDDEKHSELLELKELANNRLEELQKLKDDCVAAQQEVEKLKLEAVQIPESIIVQSSPYKCLQSQFSVLFNETTNGRQQLDELRRTLSSTKTQQMVQLEQIESDMITTHKKYKSEVNELHEALLHCKREYDLLRIECEQSTKTNEQTAPLIKEITYMNNSLQSYNKQLKGEVMRYKRKLSEALAQSQKLEEEISKLKETKPKEDQVKKEESEKTEEEMEVKQEEEAKETPKESEGGEEGELEEGEEEEPDKGSNDSERVKQLQASLKKAQESQKEMKLLLDVYKGAAKDLRDKVELLASEKTLKTEIEALKNRVKELEQDLEKYKGAMADEEAIRRLKVAEETIENLQKNLAATKQEEDALLAEMEFTGQEYVEMQEQNVRLLQQLREKDDANLKLMSERIKSNQIQKQIREEKDVLADQVTSLNAYRETQTQMVKKQEERERSLQNAVGSMEKELSLRQQAMEMHKRKALDSAQSAQELKIRLEAFQQQQQEIQESIAEKTRSLEEEAFRAKRVQEECNSLKRKIEKQKKIDLYGAADEVLLEEVRQYKARLTCPCCNTRKKDAILTKCFHVFCYECLKTRYDTRQRKCPKCNATFGNNDFHKIYL